MFKNNCCKQGSKQRNYKSYQDQVQHHRREAQSQVKVMRLKLSILK